MSINVKRIKIEKGVIQYLGPLVDCHNIVVAFDIVNPVARIPSGGGLWLEHCGDVTPCSCYIDFQVASIILSGLGFEDKTTGAQESHNMVRAKLSAGTLMQCEHDIVIDGQVFSNLLIA